MAFRWTFGWGAIPDWSWWVTKWAGRVTTTWCLALIDLLERIVLRFERQDSLARKLTKLEGFLVERGLPLAETVPLFCSLLSIPLGAEYVWPDMAAEQQKLQTMRALMTIPFRRAEKQPVMLIVEDLH
jgi:hypothetical protein